MQAWLIARDSHLFFDLFHDLRYEGHPALWYLILNALARISWNPLGMQIINYVFSITEAWLILSARKLHWVIRILLVFSFFVFHNYGAVARSYMLAMLLLTAAVRCLLAERPRRKLAILFLALSINTHILAVPVAVAIALWGFCFGKVESWRDIGKVFRDWETWVASLVLLASLTIAYLTVRPPADIIASMQPTERRSIAYESILVEGVSWQAFIPVESERLPAGARKWLFPDNQSLCFTALGFSLALFILIAGALRTIQARTFFLSGSVLVMIAIASTVKNNAQLRYYGFYFTIFLLALMMDAYASSGKAVKVHFLKPIASTVVLAILTIQALAGIYASIGSSIHPYSDARSVGLWLREQGLSKRPMVVDGYSALAVLGYMERPPAYLTSCDCFNSYALLNRSLYDSERRATLDDLRIARGNSSLPVVLLVAYRKLDQADLSKLGLTEIHIPEKVSSRGTFTVYEQDHP